MSPSTSQLMLPDGFSARVDDALKRLTPTAPIARLWSKDPALWTADVAEQRKIVQRLGWLTIVPTMQARVQEIQSCAQEVRQAGFTHAVLLGMGGSSLFSEVCRFTFGVAPGWLDLAILDSTDPQAISRLEQRAPLERTLFIVSSKSGTTTESSALCDYFYERLARLKPERAGEQCIAITDAGTALEAQARRQGFRHVFLHGPETGQDVGGRFSAMTYFGLVPAALIGVDIARLLDEALEMFARCGPESPLTDNPGAQLAVCFQQAAAMGRDKITIVSSPSLARFGSWAEQLVAESTGKSGKGLIPIDGEPPRQASSYLPDRVFVELQLNSELDRELERHTSACAQAGHPLVRIRWQDPYALGAETVRWFIATVLAASLMEINAFDEPNVQESKDRTKALLERYVQDGQLPHDTPILSELDVALYGDPRVLVGRSITDAVREFVQRIRAGDYLVLASFLPRTDALDAAVESFRAAVARSTGVATMLGHGPRYLHSTGQLHKGGPDRVAFIFLTADDSLDVPVPGKRYSFSVLKRAQALGDFQALRERNRRAVRLHLGTSPLPALHSLEALFGASSLQTGAIESSRASTPA